MTMWLSLDTSNLTSNLTLTNHGNSLKILTMTKRLQILLNDKEMRAIQDSAERQQVTVREWVRQTLRSACPRATPTDTKKKLDVVRAASRYDFPTGDIDQILREIDQGYQASFTA